MQAVPRLAWAAPQLFTADVAALARWFGAKLGFETVFLVGEPAFYGQVRRDDVRFNMRHMDEPPMDPARRDRSELLSAYVVVEDLAALYAEFAAHGAAGPLITDRPQPEHFLVKTPDGELICFAAG
ncbi:MAG TPA: VOC family protein [Caulobacteraceae bacterium]|jgi:catechol 2,3-dioxygenase-like lactoylglutathione lyase family enzyme|nr:VOC family protein [Caulobacteraceae bacterium]